MATFHPLTPEIQDTYFYNPILLRRLLILKITAEAYAHTFLLRDRITRSWLKLTKLTKNWETLQLFATSTCFIFLL